MEAIIDDGMQDGMSPLPSDGEDSDLLEEEEVLFAPEWSRSKDKIPIKYTIVFLKSLRHSPLQSVPQLPPHLRNGPGTDLPPDDPPRPHRREPRFAAPRHQPDPDHDQDMEAKFQARFGAFKTIFEEEDAPDPTTDSLELGAGETLEGESSSSASSSSRLLSLLNQTPQNDQDQLSPNVAALFADPNPEKPKKEGKKKQPKPKKTKEEKIEPNVANLFAQQKEPEAPSAGTPTVKKPQEEEVAPNVLDFFAKAAAASNGSGGKTDSPAKSAPGPAKKAPGAIPAPAAAGAVGGPIPGPIPPVGGGGPIPGMALAPGGGGAIRPVSLDELFASAAGSPQKGPTGGGGPIPGPFPPVGGGPGQGPIPPVGGPIPGLAPGGAPAPGRPIMLNDLFASAASPSPTGDANPANPPPAKFLSLDDIEK